MMSSILKSVLVVDDHEVVAMGVVSMLTSSFNSVSVKCITKVRNALDYIRDGNPVDLVVLDVFMPESNIFETIRELRTINKESKIILYTMLPEAIYAHRFRLLGIDGYVEKLKSLDVLKKAIQSVMLGKQFYDYAYDESNDRESKLSLLNELSNRELTIAQHLAAGDTNVTIAIKLGIKQSTVGTYKSRIFEKLKVNSVIELLDLLSIYHVDL